ncbi:hypothetical protein C8R44DRAFT_984203 [Mycena epipterygia]|nr:hypothetical protein C8R44DRAFT_984203 [Mycena epipterygia]
MSTPAPNIVYSKRPLRKKLRKELQAIATAMGLDADPMVPVLIKSIEQYMPSNPQIADDPRRFLPLFAHRTEPNATGKNSGDKAAEEASEASVPLQEVTGANKTLLARNVKTDPPGQFSPLVLSGEDAMKSNVDDVKSCSESTTSDEGSRDDSLTPEPEEKLKKAQSKKDVPVNVPGLEIVQVNFFDELDHSAAPRQVWVLSKEVPIMALAGEDGSTQYTTSLSKLLPVALQNDSPIKGNRGGRIYRPNIRGDPAHHHIGKIDAILAGDCRALKIGEVDTYTLRTSPGGSMYCDVFWDRSSQAVAGVTGTNEAMVLANGVDGVNPALAFPRPTEHRLKFNGAGSDVPLAIVTDRALPNPTGPLAADGVHDAFIHFLRTLITSKIADMPDLKEVLEIFTPWSRPIGGYIVPTAYDDYRGTNFTKDELLAAMNIKSSSASKDAALFVPDALKHAPKAKEWYKSGGKTNDDLFAKMTTAKFKKYLEKRRRRNSSTDNNRIRVRRRSPSPGEGSSRKHRKVSSISGDDSGDSGHYEKSSSRKRGRFMDSDNLDDSRNY